MSRIVVDSKCLAKGEALRSLREALLIRQVAFGNFDEIVELEMPALRMAAADIRYRSRTETRWTPIILATAQVIRGRILDYTKYQGLSRHRCRASASLTF